MPTNKTPNPELLAFVEGLLAKSPKKKKKRKSHTPSKPESSPIPIPKLLSTKWKFEATIYLITTTHCQCGATSTQTNPIPLIRRYHPQWGIHDSAVPPNGTPPINLPIHLEHRHVDIQACHECIAESKTPMPTQLDFFTNGEPT